MILEVSSSLWSQESATQLKSKLSPMLRFRHKLSGSKHRIIWNFSAIVKIGVRFAWYQWLCHRTPSNWSGLIPVGKRPPSTANCFHASGVKYIENRSVWITFERSQEQLYEKNLSKRRPFLLASSRLVSCVCATKHVIPHCPNPGVMTCVSFACTIYRYQYDSLTSKPGRSMEKKWKIVNYRWKALVMVVVSL